MDNEALTARMKRWDIREEDLDESFVRGSGPGGQKINKTSICVVLRHRPTGKDVRCQATRSLNANRELARQWLCDAVEKESEEKRKEAVDEKEKTRRRNRPRPASVKRKFVKHKKHRADVKKGRGGWKSDD